MIRCFVIVLLFVYSIESYSQISFTDPRDNQEYTTVSVNDLEWFQENLRFKTDSSRLYSESVRSSACGQFYFIEEAFNVCPSGWRLPTEDDVKRIIKLDKRNKIDLLDTLKVDNCGRISHNQRSKQGVQNTYWIQVEMDGTYATHWHFFPEEIKMHHHNVEKKMFPVRCVRESTE